MIDSHCHLDCIDISDREGGIQSVLDLALEHGVDRMLCISITLENDAPRRLAEAYDAVWATVGVHPCYAHEEPEVTVDQLLELTRADSVIALGETGLDGFHEPVTDVQRESFVTHLLAGKQAGLPIVVHTPRRTRRNDRIDQDTWVDLTFRVYYIALQSHGRWRSKPSILAITSRCPVS